MGSRRIPAPAAALDAWPSPEDGLTKPYWISSALGFPTLIVAGMQITQQQFFFVFVFVSSLRNMLMQLFEKALLFWYMAVLTPNLCRASVCAGICQIMKDWMEWGYA